MIINKNNFNDLANINWFTKHDNSSYWLRIYSTLAMASNKVAEFFPYGMKELLYNDIPIKICYIFLDEEMELSILNQSFIFNSPDDGAMQLSLKTGKVLLPKSSYITFTCPYQIDGKKIEEKAIFSLLNQLEALFCLYIGNNAIHSLVFEREICLNGTINFIGPYIDLLYEFDGPFTSMEYWKELCNSLENLYKAETEKAQRIELALDFIQKVKSDTNDITNFYLYWTAITIVTKDTSTLAINKTLQNIYGFAEKEVDIKLKWKWAVDTRNDIFKRGKNIKFYPHIRKYFQLLFLDLLRNELKLRPKKYLLSYLYNNVF
ncbi:MAG: hypothetical protein J0H68_04650 [Sphingobacteriia bacterium]|nr:hypothetical protein [Sphingobacteriia bacterium]